MKIGSRKKIEDEFPDFEYRSNSNIRIEAADNEDFDKLLKQEDRKKRAEEASRGVIGSSKKTVRSFTKSLSSFVKEPVLVVSVILLAFIIVFLRAYLVPSGSMCPTLLEGDRVISIARYFPNGSTYARGDVVCFTAPDGSTYVKRVIGVGGDRVQISGEKVYVNGELSEWQGTGGLMTSMDIHLGEDEYWVMGDNRANSQDSRFIGAIAADKMISKVYAIYFPFNRVTFL